MTDQDEVVEIKPKRTTIRPIDEKRISSCVDIEMADPSADEKWFLHSILTQCFLPYQDPKQNQWIRQNGHYGVAIQSGIVPDESSEQGHREVGIPYGAKPRLITCYLHTYAVKNNTKIIPIEKSMSGFMKALGFKVTGGANGTIRQFQSQSLRLAACKWTIWGPKTIDGEITVNNAEAFRKFDLWTNNTGEGISSWPTEIELTDEFYQSLKEHAIPFDYRALKTLRANPRAQDIYIWLTQRLHRIPRYRPLELDRKQLHQLFGGGSKDVNKFSAKFDECLKFALLAYPEANVDVGTKGTYIFKSSPPPIKKITSHT